MKKVLATAFVVCSGGVLLMGSSPVPTPPQAPRKDHVQVWHGQPSSIPTSGCGRRALPRW